MTRVLPRSFVAGAALALIGSTPALALDPGNYTVQCAPAGGNGATYDIRMDMVDLLTLKSTLGSVISGVRLDDGRRVILTGDRGCALTETEPRRRTRSP